MKVVLQMVSGMRRWLDSGIGLSVIGACTLGGLRPDGGAFTLGASTPGPHTQRGAMLLRYPDDTQSATWALPSS